MSKYGKITIEAPSEWEEELTMLLFEAGALGIAVDDPALIKAHLERGDWDASVYDAMQITPGRLTITATFTAEQTAQAAEEIAARIANISEISCSVEELPDIDWQQKWKEGFMPRKVGEKLLIHPCWDENPLPKDRIAVEIEPGMAFGTGDHATTAMVLELIERYLQPGEKVADLGCGTGILAIAALKLGAAQAVGVDIDPICEQVTARHCQLNNVSAAQFHFHCGNILEDQQLQQQLASNSYQLVIANINADIVCRLAALAKTLLSPQGVFLSSGILDMYSDQVETALAEAGLRIVEHLHQGEWNAYAAIAD